MLVHVDTGLGAKDLLNNRMAYVSVSRGQWDAQIFTDNRKKLSQVLGYDVSHQSAYKPEQSIPKIPAKSVPTLHQEPEISIGFGLGL